MTYFRPIKPLCPKGHQREQVKTTKVWFCPVCTKESTDKRADRLRAERISKRIRPLYL